MLWSLIKILVFVAIVAAMAFGANYLMDSTGGMMITVAGAEYPLGPLQSVLALVALLALLWVVLKLASLLVAVLKFLNGDSTALSRYFDRNREKKGVKALSEAMLALASGEGKTAMVKAKKADKYLNQPELTGVLTAQAAELSGDAQSAEAAYKKLLSNNDTRFVAVRGLMKQKLGQGETETALKLAETAFAIKPKHEEVQDVLLKLQTEGADWSGARKTLNAKLQHGALPRNVHKRRDAVLALSEARAKVDEGAEVEVLERAIEANRLSPDLIPAAVMAAKSYIEKGKARYATRVIKQAWQVQPHPELAAAFALIAPEETPDARVKRFKNLTKIAPDHPESKLLSAELWIAAEDFPEARRALGDLAETAPTVRALTMMAAIERGEGADDAVVKGWLARALTAPRGEQWICESCNHIHAEWAPVCENCQSFDTLSWKSPPQSEVVGGASAAMLPLIVGAIEDQSAEAPEGDAPSEDAAEDVIEAEVVEDVEAQEAAPAETTAEEGDPKDGSKDGKAAG